MVRGREGTGQLTAQEKESLLQWLKRKSHRPWGGRTEEEAHWPSGHCDRGRGHPKHLAENRRKEGRSPSPPRKGGSFNGGFPRPTPYVWEDGWGIGGDTDIWETTRCGGLGWKHFLEGSHIQLPTARRHKAW